MFKDDFRAYKNKISQHISKFPDMTEEATKTVLMSLCWKGYRQSMRKAKAYKNAQRCTKVHKSKVKLLCTTTIFLKSS